MTGQNSFFPPRPPENSRASAPFDDPSTPDSSSRTTDSAFFDAEESTSNPPEFPDFSDLAYESQKSKTGFSNPPSPQPGSSNPPLPELSKIFNTAMISTHSQSIQNLSNELLNLNQSPAVQAILSAVDQLAQKQGMSHKQAAEHLIATFRKLDQIWKDYVFLEGVEKIRKG